MSQGDVVIPARGLEIVVFFIWNYSNELCCDNIYKHTCSRKTVHIHTPLTADFITMFTGALVTCLYLLFYSALSMECIMYSCATDSIIVYLLFYRMETLHS